MADDADKAHWYLSLPQKAQLYLECCVISIFFTTFLMEAPYRVPYLPVIPTFFVRFPILNYLCSTRRLTQPHGPGRHTGATNLGRKDR
jgi:hypothetical protein